MFEPAHPGTRVYGRGDAYLRWEDQDDEIDENMPVAELQKAMINSNWLQRSKLMPIKWEGTGYWFLKTAGWPS